MSDNSNPGERGHRYIRRILTELPFHGEGNGKVRAGLTVGFRVCLP
jgi:hypothetical protein